MEAKNSTYKNEKNKQRILVITSVEAEKEAIVQGLTNRNSFDVVVSGVGVAAAAATTAKALAVKSYDVVINAGIAGGFVGQAAIGSIVIATNVVSVDFGSESLDGFIRIDDLGFGSSRYAVDNQTVSNIKNALTTSGEVVTTGSILTVSTVTGTAETAAEFLRREPEAKAEAMEGFGVATAAQQFNIPMVEIRTISNAVGPRDRGSWQIKEALQKLQHISSVLEEVF